MMNCDIMIKSYKLQYDAMLSYDDLLYCLAFSSIFVFTLDKYMFRSLRVGAMYDSGFNVVFVL